MLTHGHADHTTGMDGLIRALGQTNLPVLIHPEFWSRRRITLLRAVGGGWCSASVWSDRPDDQATRRGILSRWLNDLGSSGQAAFKFARVLGEIAGDVAE